MCKLDRDASANTLYHSQPLGGDKDNSGFHCITVFPYLSTFCALYCLNYDDGVPAPLNAAPCLQKYLPPECWPRPFDIKIKFWSHIPGCNTTVSYYHPLRQLKDWAGYHWQLHHGCSACTEKHTNIKCVSEGSRCQNLNSGHHESSCDCLQLCPSHSMNFNTSQILLAATCNINKSGGRPCEPVWGHICTQTKQLIRMQPMSLSGRLNRGLLAHPPTIFRLVHNPNRN